MEIPSVEEAYEEYDGVVIGQIDEVINKHNHNEVKITVSNSFKGIEVGKLTVNEDATWGNLNGPSVVGEVYLFFLRYHDDKWVNPLCSPSMKATEASAELEFLKDKEILLSNDVIPDEPRSVDTDDEELFSEILLSNDAVPNESRSVDTGNVELFSNGDKNEPETTAINRTAVAFTVILLIGIIIFAFVHKRSKP